MGRKGWHWVAAFGAALIIVVAWAWAPEEQFGDRCGPNWRQPQGAAQEAFGEEDARPENESSRTQPGAEEERRCVLNLRYDRAQTSYANLAVLTSTREEVILNFGVNVNPPTPQREVNVDVTSRIIMTYPSAKRLAITLGNVIQRYEARHGVIDVTPPVAEVSAIGAG